MTEDKDDKEEEIPQNQTVEIGSVWDMRNDSMGLFEVKRIEDNIAYDTDEEFGDDDVDDIIGIDIDDLRQNYKKLTPEEAEKIRKEMRDYHISTIQPIKGPNGKVIQIGSVWDIKEPEDEIGSELIVESLTPPSKDYAGAVWMGPEYSGFGTDPSRIFEYGTEIPLDKLQEYKSERDKKLLEKGVRDALESGATKILVRRNWNNKNLESYDIEVLSREKNETPSIKYSDEEISPEEKEDIENQYKEFYDWVRQERLLAAEGSKKPKLKVMNQSRLNMPLIGRKEINNLSTESNTNRINDERRQLGIKNKYRLRA